MDKKIGNFLFFSFLFARLLVAEPIVTLSLQNKYGKEIGQPQVGVPFVCKITVADSVQHEVEPTVGGLESFQQLGLQKSSSLTITNGRQKASSSYIFSLRAEKAEEYTLGPASVIIDGTEYRSEPVTFRVTVEAEKDHEKHTFVTLESDKNTFYEKELVPVLVTVYSSDDEISVQGIVKPAQENLIIDRIEGPIVTRKLKDGVPYMASSWKLHLVCDHAGPFKIDPLQIVVHKSHQDIDSPFLFNFFNTQSEEIVLKSNELSLEIKSLPSFDEAVDAVGKYTDFIVKVGNHTIPQNEGLLVRVIVAGTGNVAYINHPKLLFPPDLYCYQGASNLEKHGAICYRVFEYTVQAAAPGEYRVDAQKFVYFDPLAERYETLFSEPLAITVIPAEKTISLAEEKKEDNKEVVNVEHKEQETLIEKIFSHSLPLAFNSFFYWLFVVGVALLLAFVTFQEKFFFFIEKQQQKRRYAQAFTTARKLVKEALREKKYENLYAIFYTLGSTRLLPVVEKDLFSSITQIIIQKDGSEKEILFWKEYSLLLEKSSFFKDLTVAETAFLQEYSLSAVLLLEKYL